MHQARLTAAAVEDRLTEAGRVLLALPHAGCFPAGFRTLWPGADSGSPGRRWVPSPAEISAMDEAYGWAGLIADCDERRLVLMRSLARRATLIIAKLDRLARDTAFLLSIVHGAGEAGVVFCDLPQLPPGPAGTFILTMFAAVAELERGLISQRTRAALAAAKARGVRLGGRNIAAGLDSAVSRAGRAAQTARSAAHSIDVLPYIRAAQQAGAESLRQIAAALTARGIQPPSGGDRWHAQQVRRILQTATAAAA